MPIIAVWRHATAKVNLMEVDETRWGHQPTGEPQAMLHWSGSFIRVSNVAREGKIGVGEQPKSTSQTEITNDHRRGNYVFGFCALPCASTTRAANQENSLMIHASAVRLQFWGTFTNIFQGRRQYYFGTVYLGTDRKGHNYKLLCLVFCTILAKSQGNR